MTKIWAKTDIKSPFFARRAKKGLGQSPPQELEEGPRNGPQLLVPIISNTEAFNMSKNDSTAQTSSHIT